MKKPIRGIAPCALAMVIAGFAFSAAAAGTSCPDTIITNSAIGECGQTVPFTVNLPGYPAANVNCELGGTQITSPFLFPIGTNTVVCTGTNSTSTNICTFDVVVLDSEPPVAGVDTLDTTEDEPVSAFAAKLAANDSSSRGGTLYVANVSDTSAQGGTVSLESGLVTYIPPAGYSGQDQFTYIVSDGCGTSEGTVNVTVTSTNAPTLNVVSVTTTPTNRVVEFSGIPFLTYIVQWSSAANGPWASFPYATRTADAVGRFGYVDNTDPMPGTRYYRSQVLYSEPGLHHNQRHSTPYYRDWQTSANLHSAMGVGSKRTLGQFFRWHPSH